MLLSNLCYFISNRVNFTGAETAVGPGEILPLDIGQDTVLIWSTSYSTESSVSISAHVDDELEVVELDEGNNYYSNSSINVASQNNQNYYLGNTFICNAEGIVHHVNSNLGMLPPTITHSKIN